MKFITVIEQDLIIKELLNGKVALLPTDTVYGLAASPELESGVQNVYDLKERPRRFPLPVLVSKIEDLYALGVDVNENARFLLQSPFIPGAVTLILGFRDVPRPEWLKGREEVAVRIPKSEFLFPILSKTGPLLATSANRHCSKVNMGVIKDILRDLNGVPDIIVDGGILSNMASTILNCRNSTITIQREGQITAKDLSRYLNLEEIHNHKCTKT